MSQDTRSLPCHRWVSLMLNYELVLLLSSNEQTVNEHGQPSVTLRCGGFKIIKLAGTQPFFEASLTRKPLAFRELLSLPSVNCQRTKIFFHKFLSMKISKNRKNFDDNYFVFAKKIDNSYWVNSKVRFNQVLIFEYVWAMHPMKWKLQLTSSKKRKISIVQTIHIEHALFGEIP